MKKIINPIMKTTHGGRGYRVHIKIEYVDGKLSITGVEGALKSGNALGSCGQIDMHLSKEDRSDWKYTKGWNSKMMDKLLELWDKWHLNDMRAGTPAQMACLKQAKEEIGLDTSASNYTDVCSYLASKGMLEDDGYKYGTGWLTEEIPQEVISWLFSLPTAEVMPAWI